MPNYLPVYDQWTEGERELVTSYMRMIEPDYELFDPERFKAFLQELAINRKKELGIEGKIPRSEVEFFLIKSVIEVLRADGVGDYDIPEPMVWIGLCNMIFLVVPDPWFEVKWWVWENARGKMAASTMWGCQNSGKTEFMRVFTIAQMIVWGKDFLGYISGPVKEHTTDKVWFRTKELVDDFLLQSRTGLLRYLGLEVRSIDDEINVSGPYGTALCKLVVATKSSSVRGGKDEKHQLDGRRGICLYICDEFLENPHSAIQKILDNFGSNFNFFGLLGANPSPDKVQAPGLISLSDPIDFDRGTLNKETSFRWDTEYGFVVRFSWQNAVDNLLGRLVYKYLLNHKRVEKHKNEFARATEVDAWGWTDAGANTLTDSFRQRQAGVKSDFYWLRQGARYLAADPSFGGRDDCAWTAIQSGEFVRFYENNEKDQRKGIVGLDQGVIQGIQRGFIATPQFIEKISRVVDHRIDLGHTDREIADIQKINVGDACGEMMQAAVEYAILCLELNVPFSNFTFDGSQRADCAKAFFQVFGLNTSRWYYEGSRNLKSEEQDNSQLKYWPMWPYKYKGPQPLKWSDEWGDTKSMMWAFTCEVVNSGFLIGGDKLSRSMSELGARAVMTNTGNKKVMYSKAAIKEGVEGLQAKMKSPCWAETLSYAIYLAVRFDNAIDLGEINEYHEGQSGSDMDFWNEYADANAVGAY